MDKQPTFLNRSRLLNKELEVITPENIEEVLGREWYPSTTEITLASNKIGVQGLDYIIKRIRAMGGECSLVKLDVQHNELGLHQTRKAKKKIGSRIADIYTALEKAGNEKVEVLYVKGNFLTSATNTMKTRNTRKSSRVSQVVESIL